MVDVHKDKVKIFIKVPRMQQAQKLLKAMESDIKEEISSRHPEYYFSSPQRIRRHIWYEGQNELIGAVVHKVKTTSANVFKLKGPLRPHSINNQ